MLVARNYHSRREEFDLAMTDRNRRVLIKVRERNNLDYGSAADTIWETMVAPLAMTADKLRQQHQNHYSMPYRFNFICIEDNKLKWTPNAFTTD